MDRIEALLLDLKTKEPAYDQRAFYEALRQLLQEQEKRIASAEAEVDGRSWNHESW